MFYITVKCNSFETYPHSRNLLFCTNKTKPKKVRKYLLHFLHCQSSSSSLKLSEPELCISSSFIIWYFQSSWRFWKIRNNAVATWRLSFFDEMCKLCFNFFLRLIKFWRFHWLASPFSSMSLNECFYLFLGKLSYHFLFLNILWMLLLLIFLPFHFICLLSSFFIFFFFENLFHLFIIKVCQFITCNKSCLFIYLSFLWVSSFSAGIMIDI